MQVLVLVEKVNEKCVELYDLSGRKCSTRETIFFWVVDNWFSTKPITVDQAKIVFIEYLC